MYLLLFIFWIILNGKITLEIVLLGLFLLLCLSLLLNVLFHYSPKKEVRFLKKLPLFVVYLFVLVWEIVKANFAVMRTVLFEKRSSEHSVLVTFPVRLKTGWGRFLLANSITLTPGTISVETSDDSFTVHCLKREFLDTSENSVFLRWNRKLEA